MRFASSFHVAISMLVVILPVLAQTPVSPWVSPRTGWLYVIDPNESKSSGAIYLVDPIDGIVKDTIATGHLPGAVLSSKGDRLYVVSGVAAAGVVTAIDTKSGSVLAILPVPDRMVYVYPPGYFSIGLSSDGSKLFVANMRTASPSHDTYSLTTIDTVTLRKLPMEVNLGGCGPPLIMTGDGIPWELHVACPSGKSLQEVSLASDGAAASTNSIMLPDMTLSPGFVPPSKRIALGIIKTGQHYPTLLRSDGALLETGADNVWHSGLTLALGSDWIPSSSWVASSDGTQVAAGLAPISKVGLGFVSAIGIFNNGTAVARIGTSIPISSLCNGGDGDTIYGFSPEAHAISVISRRSAREIRIIPQIGNSPVIGFLAP